MEEPCEVHPDEDKDLPEKSKKRRFKTPFQLEALEKFYKEHKYPNEERKADFAKKVGLTEKQVSGWFCHRRLKDKRLSKDEACGTGRQDFSSGVIQDRGSGLKQDSCSSTKQGSYRHFDLKEVESRRFDGPDSTALDHAYDRRPAGKYSTMENTSSGSSSTSQERLLPQSVTPYDIESLRYSSRSSNYMLISKGVKNKGKMMVSGYVHLQDEIANAAIAAVKKQLGRHFREDGPALGVDFQPLPPGAFDAPVREAIHEPYQIADPVRQNSHGISKARKEPCIEASYPRYHHEIRPQGSYPEGGHTKRIVRRECSSYPSVQMVDHSREGYPDMDNMDESYAGDASMINSNNKFVKPIYGVKGLKSHSTVNHRVRPVVGKLISGESSQHKLHKYNGPKPSQRKEYLEDKQLNLVNQHREAFDAMDSAPKEDNLRRDGRASKTYENPLRVKKHLKKDTRVERSLRGDEFLSQDHVLRTRYSEEFLPRRNQIDGSSSRRVGDMQTSSREDDTAATSSSMD